MNIQLTIHFHLGVVHSLVTLRLQLSTYGKFLRIIIVTFFYQIKPCHSMSYTKRIQEGQKEQFCSALT
jgi:hypothetical protein